MTIPFDSMEQKARVIANKVYDDELPFELAVKMILDLAAAQVAEAVEKERKRCADIAKEGPWLSPCFDDENIQEQWDASEQAFGNQIAVLILNPAPVPGGEVK